MADAIQLPEIVVTPEAAPAPKPKAAANPFDRFDAPPVKVAARGDDTADGKNPFDRFDSPGGKAATYESLGRNAAAGVNEGIANIAGAPVDAMTWAINKGIGGVNRIAGTTIPDIQHPFAGSDSIKRGMSGIGIQTDELQPKNAAERIARAGGEGVGAMMTGAGGVSAARALGVLGTKAAPLMESIFGRPDMGTAAMGAASGVGGQAAAEVAPNEYKPAARLAGGLAGGVVPLGARVAYDAGRYSVRAVGNFAAPFTRAGQEAIAAQTLEGSASNPAAVRDSLASGTRELVPGSTPTTFQQTGDLGLGQLERRVRSENPDRFLMRDAAQNAARSEAIESLQAGGSPRATADYFRSLRNNLDLSLENEMAQARQKADSAISKLGAGGTPEAHGAVMRGLAQAARDKAKEAERTLWDAVDPTGRMVMPANDIAATARKIAGELSPSAKPMTGEEAHIFNVARAYGEQEAFRDVTALRSRIASEMAAERRAGGVTPAYRRLVQLRGAVEDAIDRAAENQAHIEARAVAAGTMAEDAALEARIRRMVEQHRANRDQSAVSLTGSGEGLTRSSGAGNSSPTRLYGTESETRAGFGNLASDTGLPPQTRNQIDANAAARLRAASDATRTRADTFDRGNVGQVLRKAERGPDYQLPTSFVPAKVFHPGANGGEDVRSYLRATGGTQEAIKAIEDFAATSLRNAAIKPDGSLDGAKVSKWIDRHGLALGELPEATRAKFGDVAKAEDAVAEVMAARRKSIADFDKTAAAHIAGLREPGDIVREVGSILSGKTAAQDLGDLARAARGDASARAGLRRAVVEHIQSRFLSNSEAATSGRPAIKGDALQSFIKTKGDALAKVLQPEEIGILKLVAQDLQRANRSVAATKLPGGSNTAQDVYAIGKHGSGSILGRLVSSLVAAEAGHQIGGTVGGVAGWLGAKAASALRDAGLNQVDALVTEAILNPQLARALLAKAPQKPDIGTAAALTARLRTIGATGVVPTLNADRKGNE